MIEAMNLTKRFGKVNAVDHVSLKIQNGQIFGLVGTNGAGKSTFLRLCAGVLKQDEGEILMDQRMIYDNPEAKEKLFFVPNDFYFFPNSTAADCADYFAGVYQTFEKERFHKLVKDFGLDPTRRIAEFSKGMKRQVALLLGLCAGTDYIFCDETFDGLDPVKRQAIRSLLAEGMEDRGLTPVLTSHNLREIEDLCDHIGILHEGGVLLSEDIESMKLEIQKVQCVFEEDTEAQTIIRAMGARVMSDSVRGRLHTITLRGSRETIETMFRGIPTVFFEILPLTLEEIFISETEVAGYDIKKFIQNEI